ncbi:MAG TPA: hypothetical protein VF607_06955 [Verrucomicrobiae bacterium]
MKHCVNCGCETADEMLQCPRCSLDSFATDSPDALGHKLSQAEHHFWQGMTFWRFGVILIRLQAIWFFFFGLIDLTYITDYISPYFPYLQLSFHGKMLLVRLALNFAFGIFCLRYAGPLLSWLVKDMVPRLPQREPVNEVQK